jgi:hypothetical protein
MLPVPGIKPVSAPYHALDAYTVEKHLCRLENKILVAGLRPYPLRFHVVEAVADAKLTGRLPSQTSNLSCPSCKDYSTSHGAQFFTSNVQNVL